MKKLPVLSLQRRGDQLANARRQREILEAKGQLPTFEMSLEKCHASPLVSEGIEILQVNVGKLCNMTCRHCHVDAGPDRREIMERQTIDDCLAAITAASITTLDLTGGAPEMNPDFKYFVAEARAKDCHVIDRCNLTILLANGYTDMPEFLASHQVEIVASLPCYLEENADAQRGDGSFQKSIQALQQLNTIGYGKPGSGLMLTLVYNPVGTSLPPDQNELTAAYRQELSERYGIEFNRLFTITNMPISRYLEDLMEQNKYSSYMQTLIDAFNPLAVEGVMCKKMLSVGWNGILYDCDFNQMLELPTQAPSSRHISDFTLEHLEQRAIATGRHCFGCAAASGSGCLGAINT
ncbi:MAG: arsenosugar biosynthesis radical SAM protein ArsS [Mariniblastus sp.]|nr:arsenosugar biosynthesis radical SAM protein ArsS [Mariniblastus sp.]